MDFTETESQAELAALSRKILTDRVTPQHLAAAEAGGDRFDAGLWATLASAGILAAALPEALGGAGLGLLEQCSVLTELGRTLAPVPYLASIVLGAGAITRFGSPDQQRRWAAPAGRGELILTAALSEEDGDDPAAPSARAEPVTGRRAGLAAVRGQDHGARGPTGRPDAGARGDPGRGHGLRSHAGRRGGHRATAAAHQRGQRRAGRAGGRPAARGPGARRPAVAPRRAGWCPPGPSGCARCRPGWPSARWS